MITSYEGRHSRKCHEKNGVAFGARDNHIQNHIFITALGFPTIRFVSDFYPLDLKLSPRLSRYV
jgi:hypothetical protein